MARYTGGLIVHKALTGPRGFPPQHDPSRSVEEWTHELRATLECVQQIRRKGDLAELRTVELARETGMSWTEIAAILGTTRQAAWERWHEMDQAVPEPT